MDSIVSQGITTQVVGNCALSLGMAVALGFCALFGTIIPPIYEGHFGDLLAWHSGQVTLLGGVNLAIIVSVALGMLVGYVGDNQLELAVYMAVGGGEKRR